MTIAAADGLANRTADAGNGSTTAFSFPYKFLEDEDLTVLLVNDTDGSSVAQVLNTDYTIAGAGNPGGGTVNMIVAPLSGETLVVFSDPEVKQAVDLVDNDALPAEPLEGALDRAVLMLRRLYDVIGRSVRQPDSDSVDVGPLPAKVVRASNYLAFDANGDPIATAGTTEANPVSAFMATVLDDANAAAARATLDAQQDLSSASLITTKGDLVIGGDSGSPVRKAAGTDLRMLTTFGAATGGLIWSKPGIEMFNGEWKVTVAGNDLTIELLNQSGVTPTTAEPVIVGMPQANGGTVQIVIGGALTLTITNGSTLGTVSGVPHRIYFGLVATSTTTVDIWARNPLDRTSGLHLSGVEEAGTYSGTAEGGAGGADSAHTFYANANFTNKLVRTLGFFESSQATAGVWASTPDDIQAVTNNSPKTGDVVQRMFKYDDTGDSAGVSFADVVGSTLNITPKSAANLILANYSARHIVTASTANTGMIQCKLVRDSTDLFSAGGGSSGQSGSTGTEHQTFAVEYLDDPQTTSSVTYKLQQLRSGNTSGTQTTDKICASLKEIFV